METPLMTPQAWVSAIDAPDMPLNAARNAYHTTRTGEHREAALFAIVRAERRLACQYAPRYVSERLAGHTPAMDAQELAAFEAARLRGE